jgi:predicted O-methyltransferase YrrM
LKAQDQVFDQLDSLDLEKQDIINRNYEWAKNLSWKNQATKLLEEYINPHNMFEYKGMYSWIHDLPSGSKTIFLNVIKYFINNYLKVKFGKKIDVLEIGTYTGTSLIEIIRLIPNSYGIAVDKWISYDENEVLAVVDNYKIKDSFYHNVKKAGLYNRITGIQTDSMACLLEFIKDKKLFDFIYIDGSHLLLDTYADLILAWQILEKNGILAIDDYLYNVNDKNILNSPHNAINHFLELFKGQYKILHIGYRVFVEKL